MISLVGDTHGTIDFTRLSSHNWPTGQNLTKNDYVIVLGDFGVYWSMEEDSQEKYLSKWYNSKPWTTLWLDGNHENHDRIKTFPTVEKFGSEVGYCSPSIYHLRRGHIYTIEDKTFFVMGGATSIDKDSRKEYISWWSNEIPNHAEFELGLSNLDKYQWNVDYVLSHTCPEIVFHDWARSQKFPVVASDRCPVKEYLDIIYKNCSFKRWFCGHLHSDIDFTNISLVYNGIIKL